MQRVTPFGDRVEAGRRLGEALRGRVAEDGLVLGLPRGGVVVAAEVADCLGLPLDVWLVRKLGHPAQPELALGALAEDGKPVWDQWMLERTGLTADVLAGLVAEERAELDRRRLRYRGDRPPPDVAGRTVVLVDDGIATGSTARAALRSLRAADAGRLMMAAPVAARQSVAELSGEADEIVVLAAPSGFKAVGSWYRDFRQTTDEEVLALLRRAYD